MATKTTKRASKATKATRADGRTKATKKAIKAQKPSGVHQIVKVTLKHEAAEREIVAYYMPAKQADSVGAPRDQTFDALARRVGIDLDHDANGRKFSDVLRDQLKKRSGRFQRRNGRNMTIDEQRMALIGKALDPVLFGSRQSVAGKYATKHGLKARLAKA
jgi:hypothetical protein